MSKDPHDELSDLLDSFQDDDTMEKKIEDFARKKERRSRTEKHAAEPEIKIRPRREPESEPEKIVLYHESKEQTIPEDDHEGTRVFTKTEIEEDAAGSSHTVVMDNAEIQTLIEENKGPSLQRESTQKKPAQKKKKPGADKRKTLIIILSIAGVLLIGGIVYGTIQLVNNSLHTEQSEEKHNNAFNDLKKYIENLGDDTKGLSGYESTYAKLNDSEKAEINELLRNKTGKTFDQIIEEIKSQKIEDSKNNNTQIAEQKANLKDQISQKKSDLSHAQNELSQANSAVQQAQNDMNNAEKTRSSAATALQQAQSDYDAALQQAQGEYQSKLEKMKQDLANLKSQVTDDYDIKLDQQIGSLTQEISNLESQGPSADRTALTNAENVYNNADNAYNNAVNVYNNAVNQQQQAQNSYDSINSQISDLQNQLAALK